MSRVDRTTARRQAQTILSSETDRDGFNMASYVIRLLDELESVEVERGRFRMALERVGTYTYYYGEGGMPTLMAHEVRQIVFGALDETQRLEQSTGETQAVEGGNQ